MSRLLHAAARGARIQRRVFNEHSWWNAYNLDLNKGSAASDWVYRIHPDDEHLAYGPISTALREMAEDDETGRTDLRWNIAHIVANEFNDYYDWQCEPDYPLFYLFLAEFLADEGM